MNSVEKVSGLVGAFLRGVFVTGLLVLWRKCQGWWEHSLEGCLLQGYEFCGESNT